MGQGCHLQGSLRYSDRGVSDLDGSDERKQHKDSGYQVSRLGIHQEMDTQNLTVLPSLSDCTETAMGFLSLDSCKTGLDKAMGICI